MKKYVCEMYGYVVFGDVPPEKCPQCKAAESKFSQADLEADMVWADEHRIGAARPLKAC